ncbi:MAG: efflux RND transporter periplasmic adaptor subunit [Rhizobiaceae bacterium]
MSKLQAQKQARSDSLNRPMGTSGGEGEKASMPQNARTVEPTPAALLERGGPSRGVRGNRQPTATHAPKKAREADLANAMLNLEREARKAESQAELGYLMVNGSRAVVRYRQALLLLNSGPRNHKVVAVSSLSAIDRNSTFIRWIERLARKKTGGENAGKIFSCDVRTEADENDLDASTYPFAHLTFVPLQLRDGTVFGHLLLSSESERDERSLVAAAHLCETYSHAWEALLGPKRIKRKLNSRTGLWMMALASIVAAGFAPIPLSVLSPAEVTPSSPFVVASPIDGVIEVVSVDPNTFVTEGQLLFSFVDTDLRNRVQLAGQAVGVAEARYQQSLRTSFSDPRAKRELAIAQSELQLKAGEYDYAQELMKSTRVSAGTSGLVLFADKDSWTGRPVATGERIMRIADPAKVEVTINVPVSDSIVLEEGAPVELYLDSNPLESVNARVTSASFHAQPDGEGVLSYQVRAEFLLAKGETPPRIGLRGTAKVFGETVSLAYYLMRKPLSAVRQWTGY